MKRKFIANPLLEAKEQALIRQSQAGKEEAFAELVRRYRQRIFFLCFQIIGDRELAEDVTQETFIRAFQNIKHFKMQSKFYTWIYRIAVNSSINAIRKQKASQSTPLTDLTYTPEIDPSLSHHEIHGEIEKALQKLSPEHREVLKLFDLNGLTHHEIARRLKIKPATSRSRLHYARKQMKAHLTAYLKT